MIDKNTATKYAEEKFRFGKDIIDLAEERNEYERAIKLLEFSIAADVANAVDPATGKPMYSNEDKRKNAFLKACEESPTISEYREKILGKDRAVKMAILEKELANDMLSITLIND